MKDLAERLWFDACLAAGRLLRASRYSSTGIVRREGIVEVRKRRRFHAPVLIRLGDVLMKVLGTGVRILPQREWEENERLLYDSLYGSPIRVGPGGMLVLPWLPGRTLAALLEDPSVGGSSRRRALELAAAALAELHARGFTHGDAMAENVMVDLEARVARWFDFETVHDPRRTLAWRRADDVRALVATCLQRTQPDAFRATLGLLLDTHSNAAIASELAASFAVTPRAALIFHLAQAGLSYGEYREIGRLLMER